MTAVAVRGGWGATGWDDPTMGDVGSVRTLSTRFQHRADDLRALNVELTQGLAGLGGWHGQAADRFRENQQKLRLGLDEFVVRFERCREALDQYAHRMVERRAESNALLPRVLDAQRRLKAAQHDILHPSSVESLGRGLWLQPLILNELKDLGLTWTRIRVAHDGAARWCAQRLQDSDGTMLHDLFRDAGTVLKAGQQKLGDLSYEVETWLTDNAHTIAAISDVLGDVGLVVSLIPGLAGLGLAISATSLAGKIIARQHGADEVTDADIAFSVIGLALGGVAGGAAVVAGKYAAGGVIAKGAEKLGYGFEIGSRMQEMSTGENPVKYWVPRDVKSAAIWAGAGLPTMAFWNAFQDGHAADLKAQAERRALPVVPACP